jgi:1-deoxy-D-xylulose-5-phosphate synthase
LPLAEKYDHTVVNMRFSKPLDHAMIKKIASEHEYIVTLEDNVISGGAGSAVLENLSANHLKNKTLLLGYPDYFPEHGSQDEILKTYQLDIESIENKIVNLIT